MSVQVRARREAAAFLSTYVGAQGELLVDTTNNRVQVHDGATPGGWPAAKLSEVVTNTRTSVSDASYAALPSDRNIAITSLTAARTISLPAAATYPTGTQILIFDETGACSATNTISLARAGTDTINGATSASIATAYGYLALESNGAGKWTVVDQTVSAASAASAARTPVADANYTALSGDRVVSYTSITAARIVTLPSASGFPVGTRLLILDESGNVSAANTITLARAGSDTINGTTSSTIVAPYGYVAVQSNGASKWTITDQPGGGTLGTRTGVADANYAALPSDRTIAYSTLTAARTVTLPSAAAYPVGTRLLVCDESGACSTALSITLARAGSDTINGLAAVAIVTPYGYLAVQSNGAGKWTIADQAALANRKTFVDVASAGNKAIPAGAFTRVTTMTSVNQDTGSNWDGTNTWFVCPRAGVYQITASLRVVDGTAAGTQYGAGVYTTEGDGPWFLWNIVGPTPATRSTFAYSRLSYQNAGDKLRLFAYSDQGVTVNSAGLQILLVSDAI